MNVHYPMLYESATPEYILAVIRDLHRQEAQLDPEVSPLDELTLDSTVEEWLSATAFWDWRDLGQACNQFWGIEVPDAQWQTVLTPHEKKRIGGVCQFLAQRVRRPRLRPARHFGSLSATAGAFLTLRDALHQMGVPAEKIRPSTPLNPYSAQHLGVILELTCRLAPGALPLVQFHPAVYSVSLLLGWLAGLAGLVVGAIHRLPELAIPSGLLWLVAYLGLRFVAPRTAAYVEFGDLRTFGELAEAIAAGEGA